MRYVSLMIAVVALVTMALVGQGSATSIPANQSFELGTYQATPTDWSSSGIFVKEDTTGLISGVTDWYVGQVNTDNGLSAYGYQNLAQNFIAGTTYTLITAIGMRNDHIGNEYFATAVDWTLSLNYADTGTPVAGLSGTINNVALETGFLADKTLTYLATGDDAAHAIQIRIFASTVGKTGGGAAAYGLISADNVRFAAPEPGTLILLSTGLIGLLTNAWRKRKSFMI